jgi:DNA-binding XRE family transcriptional regulator
MTTEQAGTVERAFNEATGLSLLMHRKDQGFSQTALAVEIGVHRNTVMRWETGQAGIPLWHLMRIAYVLRISHLLLLPDRDLVWGIDLERTMSERDPVEGIQQERDPQFGD